MIIRKDIFYKFFLILVLVIPVAVSSIEVTIALSVFMLGFVLLDWKFKYSNGLINAIIPLMIVLTIASVSTLFFSRVLYDIIKDAVYLIKPILFILLGFYLTSKIKDKDFVFKAIVYLAVVFALYHIAKVLYFVTGYGLLISKIRYFADKSNYVELLALVILHIKRKDLPIKKPFKFSTLIRVILYISFVFYFSRTMIVGFFVLYLACNGYTKLTRKGVIYLSLFVGLMVLVFASLQTLDVDRSSTGLEGFLYKLKNAPSEIFVSEIDTSDHANLWDHWRGYEANRAYNQLDEAPYNYGYFFGNGLGSLVDLGFEVLLAGDLNQFIPIIHNGFAYIMFKAGFVGMFIYLLFLIHLYLTAYNKANSVHLRLINNFISGIAIYYFFTSLIITGVYNNGDIVTIVLGALLSLKHDYKKQMLETA